MDLRTWFKGLCVFVLSALITSAAAAQLGPETFNFSKPGLLKLGTLALVVALKAVVLYMKQSPLASSNKIVDWNKVARVIFLAAILPLAPFLSGCVTSWEQQTYATLAASKAMVDCAVAGYNHMDLEIQQYCMTAEERGALAPAQFYIAQERQAQQTIEKARQVQIVAVEAFAGYATVKVGKDKNASIQQKQRAVMAALEDLPRLVDAVKALLKKEQRGWSGPYVLKKGTVESVAALRPGLQILLLGPALNVGDRAEMMEDLAHGQ